MPYTDYATTKRKSLEYYYQNKERVLQYQKKRLAEKYRTDLKFRQKRQLRDKSRIGKHKISGCCSDCRAISDLQRHHPDYKHTKFIVVCRDCHNQIHCDLKEKAQSVTNC